jgi:hypothetical protein
MVKIRVFNGATIGSLNLRTPITGFVEVVSRETFSLPMGGS